MCGIAGFFQFSPGDSEHLGRTVRRMADAIRHRGPDARGEWVDAEAGIALGHRRLSIIDLSHQGHQPMVSACGRYVIVFNGEIYNFQEIRRDLESQGYSHAWRGHSDTEVALAAIAHWGLEAALSRFNGMFAMAVWDRRDRLLSLALDRFGEKPLYYGWLGTTLVFGSELKALTAHPLWRGTVDRDAVALLLRYNNIPAPHSIYEGIRKLRPGQFLNIPFGAGAKRQLAGPAYYWRAADVVREGIGNRFTGSAEDAVEALDDVLRKAVKRRMMADVPLGAFLSGGIDSSTVVALMQAQSSKPIKTFTIGFAEQSHNEADDAKLVARHLGTDHTELVVTPKDALGVIPELPRLYDEPFADSSQIPTFLVSRLARRTVTVALSGDGADELFGGYNRHFIGHRYWSRFRHVPLGARRAMSRAISAIPPRIWDRLHRSVKGALPASLDHRTIGDKLHKFARILRVDSPEAMYLALVSDIAEPHELMMPADGPGSGNIDLMPAPAACSDVEGLLYLDLMGYLPNDILTKVDRASMGVSLEARIPFLDPDVLSFAWQLPLEMKIRHGKGKWILRQVLNRYVPGNIVERPKTGFGIPLHDWLRGPLREWGEGLLDSRRLDNEGFFRSEKIRHYWDAHLAGRNDYDAQLWNILMFQAWLDDRATN